MQFANCRSFYGKAIGIFCGALVWVGFEAKAGENQPREASPIGGPPVLWALPEDGSLRGIQIFDGPNSIVNHPSKQKRKEGGVENINPDGRRTPLNHMCITAIGAFASDYALAPGQACSIKIGSEAILGRGITSGSGPYGRVCLTRKGRSGKGRQELIGTICSVKYSEGEILGTVVP